MTWRIYRRMVLSQFGKRVWVYRAVGMAIAVCAGLLQAIRWSTSGLLTLALGLFLAFIYEIAAALGWSKMRSVPGRRYSYMITDHSIGIHTQVSDVSLRWDAVVRVRTSSHGWMIRTTVGGVVIPRVAFTEEARSEIDRFIGAGSFPRRTGIAS
jgi:hypothetical protein